MTAKSPGLQNEVDGVLPVCGVFGIITRIPDVVEGYREAASSVLHHMAHRGPDAQGLWCGNHGLLGHRRLSIIDLSEAGTQPLHDAERGLHIVFNGEIYNYPELRLEFEAEGYRFRTRTDTEVILAAYALSGMQFLARLRGMFSFILWDDQRQRVFLCRDRLGKKPLYYHFGSQILAASSEIKSFHALREVPLSIAPEGLRAYLTNQYITGPQTIYREVLKVLPGQCLTLDIPSWCLASHCYWSLADHVGRSAGGVPLESIDASLAESVRYRLVADVEVGVLLSGGIDSSLLASYAMAASGVPLKAFSVTFRDGLLDESDFARAVAEALDMELLTLECETLTPSLFERIIHYADEPLGDEALIPTYMIAEVLSAHVKVVLSGEGADELFWGYPYYQREMLYSRLAPAMGLITDLLGTGTPRSFDQLRKRSPGMTRLVQVLLTPVNSACRRWTSIFSEAEATRLLGGFGDGTPSGTQLSPEAVLFSSLKERTGFLEASLATDLVGWLPDDLLMKVDRMTMAHSVEARTPYLDHKLVELLLRTPARQKADCHTTKRILRRLAAKTLPPAVATMIAGRRKHGFDVPLSKWLRSDLRPIAEDMFSETSLRNLGLMDGKAMRSLWQQVTVGPVSLPLARRAWVLLCLLTWHGHHTNRFGFG
jgi:asparagine synthase (glutamine-hydrolysing)